MVRSLVTGAHGFLGSRLAEKLSLLGHQVTALPRELLYNPTQLSDFLSKERPDFIWHLATYGNLFHQRDRKLVFQANVIATWNLLETSAKVPYKGFCYISSSSVELPTQTLYSRCKGSAEHLALSHADGGKPVVIVRPASITGVGEQPEHLIPKLIDSCLTGKLMPFVSDAAHDFIDVKDFVEGLVVVGKKAKEVRGNIFGIGNSKVVTNNEVREVVERLTNKKAHTTLVGRLRPYDNLDWRVNNQATLALGWKPKFSLEKTIQSMVQSSYAENAQDLSKMREGI